MSRAYQPGDWVVWHPSRPSEASHYGRISRRERTWYGRGRPFRYWVQFEDGRQAGGYHSDDLTPFRPTRAERDAWEASACLRQLTK